MAILNDLLALQSKSRQKVGIQTIVSYFNYR